MPRLRNPDPEPLAFWAHEAADVLEGLTATPDGLDGAEAARRRETAPPALADAATRGPIVPGLVLAQLRNPLVLILGLSAAIAAAVGSYADAAIILVILVLSALLGFAQEFRAARELADLLQRLRPMARVRRGGAEVSVPAAEVVPGDILLLRAGDLIAADARLLLSDHLFTIEAPLTGEPFPVAKDPAPLPPGTPLAARASAVWTGTSVRSGTGEAVAVATGKATLFGAIAASLERREAETAFTLGIRRFGLMISEVMLVIVLAVFAANTWQDRPFFDSLTFALALAVGLTPQMLPAILSVTLSRGAHRLAKGGVISRRLSAIENLGGMDVLCTDKTGTLTEGRVTLDRATGPDGTGPDARVLALAVVNARLQHGIANALDDALLAAAADAAPPPRLGEVPYDFQRRRLSVVVEEGQAARIVTKGAVASVLPCCQLSPDETAAHLARVEAWGHDGFRVLALASREIARRATYSEADEAGLVLEGFLLFSDPLRPDARATVNALRARGVSIRVITGDSRFVAAHLARAIGLSPDHVVTGEQIAGLGADALARLVARAHVFAEVDPAGKERIVAAFQRAGHVTGFLGDGINDATALRLADIGLSVQGAADVARDAADMILTAPDLSVVLTGIDEGRRAFANTRKYLRITTAASFGKMVSMAAASVVLPFLPLTAGQILLNNLLSDLPMLALAGDLVDAEERHRPHRWHQADLPRFMALFGLISSAFDLMTFWLLLQVFQASPEEFRTAWFTFSLMTELVFALSIRTARPFWRSRPSPGLAGLSLAAAVLALALPWLPGASLLGFVPLPPPLAGWLAALLLLYLAVSEAAKRLWHGRVNPGRT